VWARRGPRSTSCSEQEAAALLGIPPTVTQAALLPVAYYTGGEFKPAKRLPARDQTHWNAWARR